MCQKLIRGSKNVMIYVKLANFIHKLLFPGKRIIYYFIFVIFSKQ